MKEKKSQKTEDQMLDQTFGDNLSFDTFSSEDEGEVEVKKEEGKKKNQVLIYALAGVFAIGVVGYIFLGGSNNVPQQAVLAPAITTAPPVVVEEQEVNIVEQQPSAGVPGSVNPYDVNPNEIPDFTAAIEQSSSNVLNQRGIDQNRGALYQEYDVTANNGLNDQGMFPAEVELNMDSGIGQVQTQVQVPVSVVDESKLNEVMELASENSRRIKELTSRIDKLVDLEDVINRKESELLDRITVLDEIDQEIIERLDKIESLDNEDFSQKIEELLKKHSAKPEVKTQPKKAAAPKPKAQPKKAASKPKVEKNQPEVLIDKTKVETEKVESAVKKPTAKSGDIKVHSIFAGRVWTRNSDGSLSTFTSGERLPNGEVIQKIEDNVVITKSGKRYQ